MTSPPLSHSVARRLGSAGLGAALMGMAGWMALRNLRFATTDGWMFWVPIATWLLTMGLLCWWSAIDAQGDSRARISASWRAGWRVGGIALALGVVGPLVLDPKASLGPLLGILLTGPLGFVLGSIVGALVGPTGSSATARTT